MLFLASDEDQETSDTHTLMSLCENSHSALVILFCVMCNRGLDNPALVDIFYYLHESCSTKPALQERLR